MDGQWCGVFRGSDINAASEKKVVFALGTPVKVKFYTICKFPIEEHS